MRKAIDLRVDGVDTKDYPDFSDAYFYYGRWSDTGAKLTDAELDAYQETFPEELHRIIIEELL